MIKLIIGLGNAGEKYIGTRHNLGFEIIDSILKENSIESKARLQTAELFTLHVSGNPVYLGRPMNYMNNSGDSVIELLSTTHVDLNEMLVVADDFNIPLGTLRIRRSGSAGGHNGLESVLTSLGTNLFARMRLGIGPLPESADVSQYVLGKFGKSELMEVSKLIDTATKAVIFALNHDLSKVMTQFNRNPAPPEIPGGAV